MNFNDLYDLSLSNPEIVWDTFAKEVEWHKEYTKVIDDNTSPTPNWFIGGEINMSYNCLDKAVEENFGNDIAVIHESPVTNTIERITYQELLNSVELFAGLLVQKCNVKKGDKVLFYLPAIPQCFIGMLACTRIGAIYTAVFPGFASHQIASRIIHIEPKLVVTCNFGFDGKRLINFKEKVDMAIKESEFIPTHCLVFNRPNMEPSPLIEGRDLDWIEEIKDCVPQKSVPLESSHPMYIIYTSGTTGDPKGFVMATGSSVVCDKYTMKYLFNIKPRESWWTYSHFGWITGQTALTYGPLLSRNATVLYEGNTVNTPNPGEIIKIMNRNKIVSFVTNPTVMRMFKQACSDSDFNFTYNDLRAIYIGGEISDLALRNWISESFKCPVYDVWGQTEINGIVTSPGLGFGRPSNSNARLMLGFQVKIIDIDTKQELDSNGTGEIIMKTPLWPAVATTIYKNYDRYIEKYYSRYPGYYDTNDFGRLLPDKSLEILARSDDLIEICSIRICGGEIEEYCLQNKNLINVAIVPLDDILYGQVPFGFLMKQNHPTCSDEEIINETIGLVRKNLGEIACFTKMIFVPNFPTTITHKISRKSLANMINGKQYQVPPTVENPNIYRVICDILIKAGYNATMPTA